MKTQLMIMGQRELLCLMLSWLRLFVDVTLARQVKTGVEDEGTCLANFALCRFDCSSANGWTQRVDLSPLSGEEGYDFQHIVGDDGLKYAWSPCSALHETGTCTNENDAAVCGQDPVQQEVWQNLGRLSTANISFTGNVSGSDADPFTLRIDYSDGVSGKSSTVKLECSPNYDPGRMSKENAEVIPETHYNFFGWSKYACPKSIPPNTPSSKASLSAGSILLIICFSIIIIYFVSGTLINVIRFGKLELPHQQFWMSFPGLASDGCSFLLYSCKCHRKPGYGQLSAQVENPSL